MKSAEARQRIERLISLFSELYDLVHEEPKPPNLSQRCRELTAEAAREVGFLDLILDRWTKRVIPWGQNAAQSNPLPLPWSKGKKAASIGLDNDP